MWRLSHFKDNLISMFLFETINNKKHEKFLYYLFKFNIRCFYRFYIHIFSILKKNRLVFIECYTHEKKQFQSRWCVVDFCSIRATTNISLSLSAVLYSIHVYEDCIIHLYGINLVTLMSYFCIAVVHLLSIIKYIIFYCWWMLT